MKNITIFLSNDGYDRGFFHNIAMFLPRELKEGNNEMCTLNDDILQKRIKWGWADENKILIFCFNEHPVEYPYPTVKIGRSIISAKFFEEEIRRHIN